MKSTHFGPWEAGWYQTITLTGNLNCYPEDILTGFQEWEFPRGRDCFEWQRSLETNSEVRMSKSPSNPNGLDSHQLFLSSLWGSLLSDHPAKVARTVCFWHRSQFLGFKCAQSCRLGFVLSVLSVICVSILSPRPKTSLFAFVLSCNWRLNFIHLPIFPFFHFNFNLNFWQFQWEKSELCSAFLPTPKKP